MIADYIQFGIKVLVNIIIVFNLLRRWQFLLLASLGVLYENSERSHFKNILIRNL